MMHVNQYDGLTIAVSEAKFISRIARRTVLSDNAMRRAGAGAWKRLLHWDSPEIRRFFASRGLVLREWDKMRTDMLTIEENSVRTPRPHCSRRLLRNLAGRGFAAPRFFICSVELGVPFEAPLHACLRQSG